MRWQALRERSRQNFWGSKLEKVPSPLSPPPPPFLTRYLRRRAGGLAALGICDEGGWMDGCAGL